MTTVTNDMLLILVKEDGSTEYPLRTDDLKRCFPNTFIPSTPDSELLEQLKVYVVEQVEKPAGDMAVEGKPELRDGTWYQTWTVRDYTPEETNSILEGIRAKTLLSIEQWQSAQFAVGFPFLAPDGEIYRIQLGGAARINIIARYTKALEAVNSGADTVFTFRSYENKTIEMNPTEMVDMCNQAEIQADLGYKLVWSLKDQTRDATTVAEIPAIPSEMFTAL